jgi:soluble lytic murein transglycosylase-like protein
MRVLLLLISALFIIVVCKVQSETTTPFSKVTVINKIDSNEKTKDNDEDNYIKMTPVSVQVYHYIKKYCKFYNVPERIAFKVAGLETSYKGPTTKYKHNLVSNANALGPMQLMFTTAQYMSDTKITKNQVRNNTELNVKLGVKYLSYLHKRYSNWKVVLGYYNTGKPIINDYALKGAS